MELIYVYILIGFIGGITAGMLGLGGVEQLLVQFSQNQLFLIFYQLLLFQVSV
jgi:hypothetical protein